MLATILKGIGLWARNNPAAAGLAIACILLFGCVGWLKWDNHALRADLAESRAIITLVDATTKLYKQKAADLGTALAERERQRAPRFQAAEKEIRNAPANALTAHDAAVLNCLRDLRAGNNCTFAR